MSSYPPHFNALLKAFRNGTLTPDSHRFSGQVEPPASTDTLDIDLANQSLQALGMNAVREKQVGAIILAGGMGTRFNYDYPKALYPIYQGKTFLELKIEGFKTHGIPIYMMTSFHTHEPLLTFLTEHDFFGYREKLHLFQQFRLPRLNPDGSVRDEYAASGHGDFVQALRESGHLQNFLEKGGQYLLFSNIDNLGATFEPAILGLHIRNQKEMTIEVAEKLPGDKGGAPAQVDGQLQLVEEFLFPPAFDQDQITVFNTASYIFQAKALDRHFELPWYVVEKQVDDQPVYQFEHLAGDLSRYLRIQCVQIDRDQRFLPVKRLRDVETVQYLLEKKAKG